MFFLKLSERAKGNRYRYSFLSVDTMCDPCFPELSLDGVMQYCLPYNMKTQFSQVKPRILGNVVVHCDVINTAPAHANPVVTLRMVI